MADAFFTLSRADQREALLTVAARSGRPAHLLEKDLYVVWLLRTLFNAPFGADLTFKGGTSLSKAYKAIQRFSEDVDITYDIRAEHLPEVTFPEAKPQVMHAERTFWEKATAIHVYCRKAELAGYERLSRHWYDVVCLDDAGIADRAIMDTALRAEVARHKAMFFREKDAANVVIDYHAAVTGSLCLVPTGQARVQLADDYAQMLNGGLFMTPPPSFEEVVTRCSEIQDKVNSAK